MKQDSNPEIEEEERCNQISIAVKEVERLAEKDKEMGGGGEEDEQKLKSTAVQRPRSHTARNFYLSGFPPFSNFPVQLIICM